MSKKTISAPKKAVADGRYTVKITNRPQDNKPCYEIYFLDNPHKSVKDALKSFTTDSGYQAFHWCDWTGAWYATKDAIGDNIENVKTALTDALDRAPAKGQRVNNASISAEMAQMRVMMAQMAEMMAKMNA